MQGLHYKDDYFGEQVNENLAKEDDRKSLNYIDKPVLGNNSEKTLLQTLVSE